MGGDMQVGGAPLTLVLLSSNLPPLNTPPSPNAPRFLIKFVKTQPSVLGIF